MTEHHAHANPCHNDRGENRREYLLVNDLAERVQLFRGIGLKVPAPDHEFFLETQDGLAELVQSCLLGPVVRSINMQSLSFEILSRARTVASNFENAYIVSSCMEIANPSHGHTLEINRLVDFQGNILGIGPRPGYPSVESQIHAISSAAGDRPIIIIEDGVFSGGTLCDVVRKLGKNVVGIVVGFVFPDGRDRLCNEFDESQLHIVKNVNNPADWVPDHDFFPFIPNCGRVLGAMMNGNAYPLYDYDGFPFSMPYLLPFAPMREWAGLDVIAGMSDLTQFCLERTIELFHMIGSLNDCVITPNHLRNCRPRVCIPFQVGHDQLPRIRGESISRYLHAVAVESL